MATTITEPAETPLLLPEQLADLCRRLLLWLPLLPVAVGLASGITFDRFLPAPWPIYLGLFLLAGGILVTAFCTQRSSAPLAIISLFLAAAAVGGLRHQVTFWRVSRTHILNFVTMPPARALPPPPAATSLPTNDAAVDVSVVPHGTQTTRRKERVLLSLLVPGLKAGAKLTWSLRDQRQQLRRYSCTSLEDAAPDPQSSAHSPRDSAPDPQSSAQSLQSPDRRLPPSALRTQDTGLGLSDSVLRPQSSLPTTPSLARLRGTIVTDPIIRMPEQTDYGLPTSNKPRTSFTLEAEQILTPEGWRDCDGLVRVSVRGRADHIRLADAVELYASLHPIEGPRNPGEYDWQLYNRRCGLYVAASVSQPESIQPRARADAGDWSSRLVSRFRQGCRRVLLDGIATDEPEAGLLATYVAGQRSAANRQINDAFRRSGTAHLLAVSGSHVALIATVGAVLGWLLLGRPKRAALVAFAAVVFFSLLVEPNAPALRSAVMAILAVSGMLLNRPFNTGNWLAGSAALLLLVNPTDLFSPAFQMTFAAVIGLVVLTPAVHNFLFGPHDLAGWLRLRIRLSHGPTRWGKASMTVKSAISYSTAAWLANVPLLIWHFGQFNPYGHVATLLITPLASLTLILGFFKLLLGLLSPSLGELLAWPVEHLAGWMSRMAEWLGSWPGAALQVATPPAWLVVVIYAALAYWAITVRRRWQEASPIAVRRRLPSSRDGVPALIPRVQSGLVPIVDLPLPAIFRPVRPRYVLTVAAALSGMCVLTTRPSIPDHPRMHVLAVGDGLCVVVRSPSGQNLLYDCGSLTVSGVGEKIVVPALQALGVRQIDAVILSHANIDHYDGLIDLAKAIPIRQVFLSSAFRREAEQGSPRRLLRDLTTLRVPLKEASAGASAPDMGPITIDVLWPPADPNVPPMDANDTSVVARICWRDKGILLTGDIGRYPQARLARNTSQTIRADVLLLPHHGSPTTLTPPFVQAVAPQVAIASTVNSQRASQAAQGNLPGGTAIDTQSGGMITVDLLPTGPHVTTFLPVAPLDMR